MGVGGRGGGGGGGRKVKEGGVTEDKGDGWKRETTEEEGRITQEMGDYSFLKKRRVATKESRSGVLAVPCDNVKLKTFLFSQYFHPN